MDIKLGLLTITRVNRDATAILKVQPLNTPLEKFSNKTMRASIASQNNRNVRFQVVSKDSGRGELVI
jgi:hypothetical protein